MSMPLECAATLEPDEMPGAPAILGWINEVNRSQIRLHNTPSTTSTLAPITSPVRWRFLANTRMQKGTIKPAATSNQKNGAVAPENISPRSCAPPAVWG